MTGGFDTQTGTNYPGVEDTAGRKQTVNFKAKLLEKRALEVGNFIAGNIMRTSAAMLRKEAVQ